MHRRQGGLKPIRLSEELSGREVVRVATAVWPTVAKALRIGKTASHGNHFTAIRAATVVPISNEIVQSFLC